MFPLCTRLWERWRVVLPACPNCDRCECVSVFIMLRGCVAHPCLGETLVHHSPAVLAAEQNGDPVQVLVPHITIDTKAGFKIAIN